jgi:uncharacterized protein YndB with AHSA1/START domain
MTTMTSTNTNVSRVYIRATPEQVWKGITDPEFTERYYFGTRVDSTLTPGDAFVYRGNDGQVALDGEVVECDPPRRLVQTFRALWGPEVAAEPASRVTWEVEEDGPGGCRLTVTHDQLDASPITAQQVAGGWAEILSGLKTVLETGRPLRS